MAKSNTNTLLMIGAGLVAVYIFTKPKAPVYPYGSYPPGYIPPTSSSGGLFSLLGNLFHGSSSSGSSGSGSSGLLSSGSGSSGSQTNWGNYVPPGGSPTLDYAPNGNVYDKQGNLVDTWTPPASDTGSSSSSGTGVTDLGGGSTTTSSSGDDNLDLGDPFFDS